MDDNEFPEGNDTSEPADLPGVVPADDGGRDAKQGGIDSGSVMDAPVLQSQRKTARTAGARKAFAEAILASKKEAASKPPTEVDELDPEAAPVASADLAAKGDAAAAKAAGADAKPVITPTPAAVPVPAVVPPAPSLDPEVRKLREMLQADRDKIAAERVEMEKQRKAAEPTPVDALSLEDYIDNAPRAYRNWLESMRGEKYASDEEYHSEVKDFITQMSVDVLGVPLSDNVRAQFDAAQAKKIVRTHKTIQTRKEAALAVKLEKERAEATSKAETQAVEAEWSKAAGVLAQQFAAAQDAEGKPQTSAAAKAYPWLAAEDKPGEIIVDVIRSALTKDGTQLSWQEASQRANDFLANEAKRYYDKRKPLLTTTEPAKPVVAPAKPVATAPVTPPVRTPAVPQPPQKWSREKHLETTRAAFRAAVAGKTE